MSDQGAIKHTLLPSLTCTISLLLSLPWHALLLSPRIYLPGKVIQGANDTASYIADTQCYECRSTKQTPGEYFKDLDMISKLLQPDKQLFKVSRPGIEVVGSGYYAILNVIL